MPSLPFKMKILSILAKNSRKTNYTFPVVPYFTWKLELVSSIWMVVACFFNSLPKGEYLNILIVASFSDRSFTGKISSLVKNLYLTTFLEAEVLAVCLCKLC